ncbi:restriction endonuclease subunit S [Lacticaseibacillus paracasei]|uniref:restriction endonuclease subunit S n=1 Tax=Lacticaseibacillus paracasei TaxID=1597 RepID=UPI0030898502|nr:restriction endonuclease subunit S [Lacticaseibacillus paracasei]WQG47430.1 restriction endonuclease subunit S [Lacticaseibacillus casei]
MGETNSYFTDGNYGESYPKESELSDKENGVPFLRGSNLRNGELIEDNANYITKEKHAELTSGHLVEDDIVLAVRGSLGALGYVKEENIDWNINSQLAVIRTDKSELSGKFLAQFLLSWRGQKELLSRNTGTALKQLPIKQLKDVPVPIVNLDEQKEISALFTSIDNLIAATQDKIDALEQAKRALLQRLFDQSWRFKGYSDPWEKRKLGETNSYFTDGNYGESYPKESELSDKENGVPFLRGSNLRNGELIEDNANYITKEKHAELTSGHLVEDDIVLAVRGSLGALGYVKEENIDWNINSQLAVIRTDKSELSGKFLAQFLLSWRGQKELLSRNTGTALKQLPIKQLKDVPVPIVNLDEQKEISALFTSIDNLIAATQSRLSSLELLKKALLQDLFI